MGCSLRVLHFAWPLASRRWESKAATLWSHFWVYPLRHYKLKTSWLRPDFQLCTRTEFPWYHPGLQCSFTGLRTTWDRPDSQLRTSGGYLRSCRAPVLMTTVTSEVGVTICVPRERYFGQDVTPWNSEVVVPLFLVIRNFEINVGHIPCVL